MRARMLLSGRSTEGVAEPGPVICACFGVAAPRLPPSRTAGTAAEIGERLKAGTNCGSCIPEIKRLIAERPVSPAPQQAVLAAN